MTIVGFLEKWMQLQQNFKNKPELVQVNKVKFEEI